MNDAVQAWARSGQDAVLDRIALRPRCRAGAPVVKKSEEAWLYFLVDRTNKGWVLKKFSLEQERDRTYLEALRALIPRTAGFESGFERRVLTSASASRTQFWNDEFAEWLDGAVLMPQVGSATWTKLADSIRVGSLTLSAVERLLLCRTLSELVQRLEVSHLAHRDLSGGNVLIDSANLQVHFIDWEGLYHPGLTLQSHSTWGTEGYTSPFIETYGPEHAYLSWCEKADRFALAVLNVELLILTAGSGYGDEGGLLLQSDINNQHGPTLSSVRDALQRIYPDALELFEQALNATRFIECPGPADWVEFAHRRSSTLPEVTEHSQL